MEVKKNKKNKQIFAQLFVRPLTAPAPRPTDPGVSPAANACSYNASGRIAQLPQLIRACPAPAPKKRTFVRGARYEHLFDRTFVRFQAKKKRSRSDLVSCIHILMSLFRLIISKVNRNMLYQNPRFK